EVMGRHAGFVALRSGIAGGADAILVPEIPYDVARVVAKVRAREQLGLRFSIVVVGEGARPVGGAEPLVEPAHDGLPARLGGAAERLAGQLVRSDVRHEVRVTVLGHLQRGGPPTASDRLLATRFGVHAAELCAQRRFARMVAARGGQVDSIPLAETQVHVARIDPEGELARCARSLGIELGAAAVADSTRPGDPGTRTA
ncbi:MAG: 6-phosphofructokinase, partial [Polyangiaceae bacterium]